MRRIFVIITLIFIPLDNYGAMVEVESGAAARSYGGAAGDSAKYSMGLYIEFLQNRFFAYNGDFMQINSGIDFNYHLIEHDETVTEFYQFGAAGAFSLEKYFSKNGYNAFYPYIPFHGGYVRSVTESELKNIESGSYSHLFAGIGAGLAVFMGEYWGTKASYTFDAHFLKGGIVQAHTLSLGVFFRYNPEKK